MYSVIKNKSIISLIVIAAMIVSLFPTVLVNQANATATEVPAGHLRVHYNGNVENMGLWLFEDTTHVNVEWAIDAKPFLPEATDAYGAYIDVPLKENAKKLGIVVVNRTTKEKNGDNKMVTIPSAEMKHVWLKTDDDTVYPYEPVALPENTVRVHYSRTDNNYTNLGLWTFHDADSNSNQTTSKWPTDAEPITGTDLLGAYVDIKLKAPAQKLGMVVVNRTNEAKDGNDKVFSLVNQYKHIFIFQGDDKVYVSPYKELPFGLVSAEVVSSTKLHLGFTLTQGLTADGVKQELQIKDKNGATIAADTVTITGNTTIEVTAAINLDNLPLQVTYSGKTVSASSGWRMLDELYSYDGDDLGATYHSDTLGVTLKLWAPTASAVTATVYGTDAATEVGTVMLDKDAQGVWSKTILPADLSNVTDLKNHFYQYGVTHNGVTKTVLDPYAKSMAAFRVDTTGAAGPDGDTVGKAAIIDLSGTNPETFDYAVIPGYEQREDAIIWEIHVRDLTSDPSIADSGNADTINGKRWGTYSAFIEKLDYIKSLGVTHVQLLPVMAWYYGDELNMSTRELNYSARDNEYNWGYDPHSYFSPDGAYSANPTNPELRVQELKELIDAIHEAGMGVLLDVVYTHMAKADFLNDIVPNYYAFQDANGNFLGGFGNNLATNRKMAEKLMVDSVKYWFDEYKIDGMRWDMMGDATYPSVQNAYNAAKELNPNVLFIGEGWRTFSGTVSDPSLQGMGADQDWMNQTDDVGVFSDEIRNELKSGFGHEGDPRFITRGERSIATIFNNIKGQPSNTPADDPGDMVQYIAAHDNQPLYDIIAKSIKKDPVIAENNLEIHKRIRLGNTLILTSQGIAFLHAGQEYGRTKQWLADGTPEHKYHTLKDTNNVNFQHPYFIHDSYDSSDAINMFDWTKATDAVQYPINHVTSEYTKGLIELRKSTNAFRLGSKSLVDVNVTLLQAPEIKGDDLLIAYKNKSTDGTGSFYVFVNTDMTERTITLEEDLTGGTVIVDNDEAGTTQVSAPTGFTLTATSIKLQPLTAVVIKVPTEPSAEQPISVTVDGIKEAAWDTIPTLGTSSTKGWESFHINNLKLTNDNMNLYYWVDATNVGNWGANGQFINIALNVDGVSSSEAGNPTGFQFTFSGTTEKPDFHIVHRVINDDGLGKSGVYAASNLATPILSTDTSLKGAQFAAIRKPEAGKVVGFEGKIPLSELGLQMGAKVSAIAVLSGDNKNEHGAFDIIPEDASNEIANAWNESSSKNIISKYTGPYTVKEFVTAELMAVSSNPGVGDLNVPLSTNQVSITFNDNITVKGAITVSDLASSVTASGQNLTIALNDSLEYGKTYEVAIPIGSLEGSTYGSLQKDLSFSFTVEADPMTKRYVYFYYDRTNDDYQDWNIWRWYGGSSGQESFDEQLVNGMKLARFEVPAGVSSVGFKLRRGEWLERDIDLDRNIVFDNNQKTVKVFVKQGVTEVKQLKFLNGPEADDGITTFYYRDEKLFRADQMNTIDQVKLVLTQGGVTTKHAMSLNEAEQYFSVGREALAEGKAFYSFEVTRNGVTTEVLDAYNPNVENGKSVIQVRVLDWTIAPTFSPATIHYDQGAVLTIDASVTTGNLTDIKEVYADLTSVGGSAKEVIDPILLKQTIAVKDTTAAGVKNIPVKLKDKYGNSVTATAKLTIAPKQTVGKLNFDWDEARIYFVLTDRFHNGDPTNDNPNGENYDKTHLETYHGGDFQGLINKMQYIKDLGVNTLWITPIVDNIDFNVAKGRDYKNQYGYHGYWTKDFTELDEHLGDINTFKKLIDTAHDHGIKIMVDIVVNHTGYGLKATDTNSKDATNFPTDQDRKRFENMLRSTTGAGELTEELNGLPDFVTEDPAVREKIVQWQAEWLNRAKTARGDTIDYFRVDTVKHVEHTTWRALKNAVTVINPDFKMIGEFYGADYISSGRNYVGTGQMDSLLDFDFKHQAEKFVNGDIDAVQSYLEARNEKLNNMATMGQFLSSHDEDGFLHSVGNDEGKLKVAAALQITSKGQPVIYYGEELGSTGPNADFVKILGENRKDMPWNNVTTKKDLLTHYQLLLNTRAAYSKVFSKGTLSKASGGTADQYLVFKRTYKDESLYVGLNVTNTAKTVTFKTVYPVGSVVVDKMSNASYLVKENNMLTIQIPAKTAGGTVILAVQAPSSNPSEPVQPGKDKENKESEGKKEVVNEDSLKNKKEGKVVVEVGKGVKEVLLPLTSAKTLEGAKLELKKDNITVELPAAVLDAMNKLLPADAPEGAQISFESTPVEASQAVSLINQSKSSNASIKPVSEVYEFTLAVVGADGSKTELTTFEQPIRLKFTVDSTADANVTGVYYISDDGKIEYVGGTIVNGTMSVDVFHFSKYAVLEYRKSFADVPSTHWASKVVQSLAAKQIVNGKTDDSFAPSDEVTRAEFTEFLVRALGLQAKGKASFTDVAATDWYAGSVAAASEAGIVRGNGQGSFAPNAKVTREEMAVMLMRAYAVKTGQTGSSGSGELAFTDRASVSEWAKTSIAAAVKLGLLKGRDGSTFAPAASLQRAESAQVIFNLLKQQ